MFFSVRQVSYNLLSVIREIKAFGNYLISSAPKRPCHYRELFINSKGDIFPCCLTWNRKFMRIGNISDENLQQKINSFRRGCSCDRYRLRHPHKTDKIKYSLMNLELSLLCQGSCIMCCVDAPSWRGSYNLYSKLEKMISECTPDELLVQGGEVLVQSNSLAWLRHIRSSFPLIRISLVTNGSVPEKIVDEIDGIFDRITVSFCGFQKETYAKIMGLDLALTLRFIDRIQKIGRTKIYLKYLITPLSIHETPLFLDWAVGQNPDRIALSDANCTSYIKMGTDDSFWQKVIKRTADDVLVILLKVANREDGPNVVFSIDSGVRRMFGIDDIFIREHNLQKCIDWT